MKNVRMVLSVFCFVFALMSALAFDSPAVETAWFALDTDTGDVEQYLGSSPPPCQQQINKFCAAEYPGVQNGAPVGTRLQTINNAKRIVP